MKYIATTSDKINTIDIISGQLIFSRDDRVIYLDSDIGRTCFQQIMSVATEFLREHLVDPVQGFYFVKESKMLYNYDEEGNWILISQEPENLFFESEENFPTIGNINKLYIEKQKNKIFRWDMDKNVYTEMSAQTWGTISL